MRGEFRPVHWLGDSLDRLREFPRDAQCWLGFELGAVQRGDEPSDWKPMTEVGPGVSEIRVHGPNEYRLLHVAKFKAGVDVLHTFVKRTRKTSRVDIDLATKRYRDLVAKRRKQ